MLTIALALAALIVWALLTVALAQTARAFITGEAHAHE